MVSIFSKERQRGYFPCVFNQFLNTRYMLHTYRNQCQKKYTFSAVLFSLKSRRLFESLGVEWVRYNNIIYNGTNVYLGGIALRLKIRLLFYKRDE